MGRSRPDPFAPLGLPEAEQSTRFAGRCRAEYDDVDLDLAASGRVCAGADLRGQAAELGAIRVERVLAAELFDVRPEDLGGEPFLRGRSCPDAVAR